MASTRASMLVSVILPLACLVSDAGCAAPWTVRVDQRNGLPAVSLGGGAAISSDFAFWGKNWTWASFGTEFKVVAPFVYSIIGENQALDFNLIGGVRKPSNQQLIWEFDFDARSTTSDVIGGGISFKFDLLKFASQLGEPELLPSNRGWSWGHTSGSHVEMRFEPPMASIYFEGGRKSEIRAFFYKGEVPQGQRHYAAVLNISDDMMIGQTTGERFGLDDYTAWQTKVLDWNTAPVDLSFLNASEKPAGKRGFLRVVKDTLIFGDGTPARFWGTNLTAYTLFGTPRENVKLHARRLSQLGFNLVRLHHHDSPWVNPNIFGDQKSQDTKNLDAAMLERLDWWIKCLRDEGIYIWLDLHVERQFRVGDAIEGFNEISKGKPTADLKGYNYVNASVRQAMQRFNDAYVSHYNALTGLRYKDDPAIVAMLLTNENDLTHHYGNRLLPDKDVPWHNALYMAEAAVFAAKYGLPKDKVWRSWEQGASKLFLNDLQHGFDTEIIQELRELGVKVPIVTTSFWGGNPLSSLPALTAGNLIDAHSYGGIGELEKNPIYAPNLIHWIAAAQIVDRPLSVTEWNVSPFPAGDRHAIPLYIASAASLQGWDALLQYAYSEEPLSDRGTPSNWHAFNDPALMATLPAAALLYRRKDVQEAGTVYVFAPSQEQLFNQVVSPENAVALRTAAEKGKLVIALPEIGELPWIEKNRIPVGAKVITDLQQPVIGRDAYEAVSDTGELRRNWEQGIYTIDTPRTQAAMGWIGGKRIRLADVEIETVTRNATVAVQSLDGKNIGESRDILISLGARSVPKSMNQMPFYSESVIGRLTIHASKGLRLYKKRGATNEAREIPVSYESGRYRISLDWDLGTYWLSMK